MNKIAIALSNATSPDDVAVELMQFVQERQPEFIVLLDLYDRLDVERHSLLMLMFRAAAMDIFMAQEETGEPQEAKFLSYGERILDTVNKLVQEQDDRVQELMGMTVAEMRALDPETRIQKTLDAARKGGMPEEEVALLEQECRAMQEGIGAAVNVDLRINSAPEGVTIH